MRRAWWLRDRRTGSRPSADWLPALRRPRSGYLIGALALCAVACVDANTTMCGDLVCPVGKVCAGARTTCVLPAQLSACAGLADRTACAFPGEDHGGCDHGVCFTPVCGNGVMERGEACDDGNTADHDGCAADCTSREVCGDGVVDEAVGEQCDDGGRQSHDGCSSQCLVEIASWRQLSFGMRVGSQAMQLAYDATLDRVVMFGGLSPTFAPVPNLFEYDGKQWIHYDGGATVPSPREGHVLVYDARHRRDVLFGGASGASGDTLDGDTWTYASHTWTAAGTSGPSPRKYAAAAYDAARGQVVLFGGADADGASGETWILDGTTWTLSQVSGPPARSGHVMAYDSHRARVVLFGGSGAQGPLDDTWEWDGAAWQLTVASRPLGAARGAMAYDASRQRTVIFAGDTAASSATWEYDGGAWTAAAPTASPPARQATAVAYDAHRHRVVAYGGGLGRPGTAFDDTWEYDGSTWTQVTTVDEPPTRQFAAFAYDPLHARTVLFGGDQDMATHDLDTWTYDGAQWVNVTPPGMGSPPMGGPPIGLVNDSARGRLIMARPAGPSPLETWSYAGDVWTRLATPVAPAPRTFSAMAYDSARDRVVLFGGETTTSTLAETWEFDGTTWAQRTPAASPPGRTDAAMVYDPVRRRTVLFGGQLFATDGVSATPFGDTWEWDGDDWVQITTPMSPPARAGTSMVYFAVRGTVVLFGGTALGVPTPDTWEYDGAAMTWTPLNLDVNPGAGNPRLTYDSARKTLVAFAGAPSQSTWELSWRSSGADEVCGNGGTIDNDGDGLAGCADPDCAEAQCGADGTACSAGACVCRGGPTELNCGDGQDDDCDGLVDCADPDCAAAPGCQREDACGDGVDNDGDGLIDCADPDCFLVGCAEIS